MLHEPASLTRDEWRRIGKLAITGLIVSGANALGESLARLLVDALRPKDDEADEDEPQGES